jgi:hypothetical protein
MPLDPLIASGGVQAKFDDPVSKFAQLLQAQGFQQKNQEGALALQTQQRTLDESNRLRDVLSQPGFDPNNVDYQRQLVAAAPQVGLTFLKANADFRNANALTDKNISEAGKLRSDAAKTDTETGILNHDQAIKVVASFSDPASAANGINAYVKAGKITPEDGQIYLSQVPQNPADMPKFQLGLIQGILSAKDRASYMAPTADTVANNNTSITNNAANNSTSRSNNADNIKKDYGLESIKQKGENLRAGFDTSGNPTGDMETTARAIASGQLPPPGGMALTNPKNQRILARVMEINPNYDFTDVTAKKKAASDFTSGNQGNALRSFAVAGQHLDQLGGLVDALDNGNMQIVNNLGNAYASQTGSPAPTNFDAAKDVVSKEVMKAIVGGGGGVSEREELSKSMSAANSPAQLKGVIAQYRNLMSAQHDALLQQRRAAGLSDATLPKYISESAPSVAGNSVHTPDGQVHIFPNAEAAAAFKKAAGL